MYMFTPNTYIHTYIHTYIYTYIHTHIHTYIHTYTHTHLNMLYTHYTANWLYTYTQQDSHTHKETHIHVTAHTKKPYPHDVYMLLHEGHPVYGSNLCTSMTIGEHAWWVSELQLWNYLTEYWPENAISTPYSKKTRRIICKINDWFTTYILIQTVYILIQDCRQSVSGCSTCKINSWFAVVFLLCQLTNKHSTHSCCRLAVLCSTFGIVHTRAVSFSTSIVAPWSSIEITIWCRSSVSTAQIG